MKKLKLFLEHFWWILVILMHLGLLLITRFTAWPEMLTYPWLLSHGFRYYGDIIQPYLPLLSYGLWFVYQVAGLSVTTLQAVTLITIIITDLLILVIAKKFYQIRSVMITLCVFILLQVFFEGNGIWFDLASLPLILISVYLLLVYKQRQRPILILLSGLCIGLAGLMKQTNFLYLIPASLIYIKQPKSLLRLIISSLAPLLILIIIYSFTDQFKDFLYWGLWHPLFVQSRMPGFALWPKPKQLLVCLFIFSPLLVLLRHQHKLLLWFLVSLIFVIPRFGYFHFQHAVAFFSLIFPSIFIHMNRLKKIFITLYFIGLTILFGKYFNREYNQPVRFFEPGVMKARQLLENQIPYTDKIFFYNVSSEYFVGTRLIPNKPWAYEFPWYLEIRGVQEKIIQSLQNNQIKYVIFKQFGNEGKYVPGSYRPLLIDQYINSHYLPTRQLIQGYILLERLRN